MNKKIIFMLIAAIISIGGLASCQKSEAVASYKIGALVSQTGSYAGLGLQAMEGMQLMVDKVNESGGVNGIPLELVISDDKSETTEAVLAARRLVEVNEVHVLVSASQTAISMSLVPVANEKKVPTVILSGTTLFDNELGDWIFRPTGQEDSYITLNLEYLSQELGISKYADWRTIEPIDISRYIKTNGEPFFVIYIACHIPPPLITFLYSPLYI